MAISHNPGGFAFIHSPVPRLVPRSTPAQDQPSDDDPSDSDSDSKLKFVNVGTFDESKSLKTRKIVRGHVMKRVRKAQRDLRVRRQLKASAESQCSSNSDSRSVTPSALLSTPLGAGYVDPFNSYPAEMTPFMHQLVAHYVDVFSGANLPFHPNKDGENPLVKTFFPTVFSSPALLQGILCITSSHLDAAEGRTSSNRRTLAYRGEAIRLVREGFQHPDQGISDGAIGTIMLLSSHEVFFGDRVALDCHMQGLFRMVDMRGGLDSLGMDGILKTMILWTDQYCALFRQLKPRYSTSQYHRAYRMRQRHLATGASSTEAVILDASRLFDTANNIGGGFREARNQGLLPPNFACSLEGFCHLARLRDGCLENRLSECQVAVGVNAELENLETLFASFQFSDPLPGSYEQCCSTAAAIYNNIIFRNLPVNSPEQVSLAERLREALEDSDMDYAWSQNLEMLIWILYAASALDPGNPVRAWFRRELRGSRCRLKVVQRLRWEDTKRTLSKFLWGGTSCEDAGRELFVEITRR